MADTAISALTEVTGPASTDMVPIVNAGATKKVTVANLVAAAGLTQKSQLGFAYNFMANVVNATYNNINPRTNGSGTVTTTQGYGACKLTVGGDDSSLAGYESSTTGYMTSIKVYNLNPKLDVFVEWYPAISSEYTFGYLGSYCAVGWTGGSLASYVQFGFKFTNTNGTTALLATCSNGSTETTTDITSQVTLTPHSFHRFHAEMTSGSSIKFYVDGVLVATHTTNLPTNTISRMCSAYKKTTTSNTVTSYLEIYYHSLTWDVN